MEDTCALSPMIEEDTIVSAIEEHLCAENTNWGELNSIGDLYTICDAVSAKYNGLLDSVLRPAMQCVLERSTKVAETAWARDHIFQLTEMWRHEVNRDTLFPRNTRVVMEAPPYKPYIAQKPRKRKRENYESGRAMLSVSALLKSSTFAINTANGKVAVKEDVNGNITLNGEELSFNSWSRITKTNDPEVVSLAKRSNVPTDFSRKNVRDYSNYKTYRRQQENKQSEMSMNLPAKKLTDDELSLERVSANNQQSKELDEGEIDSEEERRMEKQNKRIFYISSSEDSDGEVVNARKRRSLNRISKKNGDYNSQTLTQLFTYRHQLMMFLPLNQKQQFVALLKKVTNKAASQRTRYR